MQIFRRAMLAVVTVLATVVPASAQSAAAVAANAPANGTLVTVWGWILVAGIVIFVAATSFAVRSGK